MFGETVLVNGATGVSRKIAIQIAKLLGAGRIVGAGRDDQGLHSIVALGADAAIDMKQSDEEITEAFRKEAGKGYDVVLDGRHRIDGADEPHNSVWDALARETQLPSPSQSTIHADLPSSVNLHQESTIERSL